MRGTSGMSREIYDTPRTPASIVGSAGHKALEHFYSGAPKDIATQMGLNYMRNIADFEINFGTAKSRGAPREARRDGEGLFASHRVLSCSPAEA